MSRKKKRKPKRPQMPRLYIRTILAAADAHYSRTGRWPTTCGGEVETLPPDTWKSIDHALRNGWRGCRPGGSLPMLLHRYRGRPLPTPRPRPRLTVRQVLAWSDAFHRRTGQWPVQRSGPVAESPLDTWRGVDYALRLGLRGLPGGDSLPRVLIRYRGVLRANYRPTLTIAQILAWADAHHARTGRWPSFESGPVRGVGGERWPTIHAALEHGSRGLPTGYTLATLLQKYRGHAYLRALPRYTEKTLLAWADAHYRRHGRWPNIHSGVILEAPGETWRKVEGALYKGYRGMPGGDSLCRLLMRRGRRQYREPVQRCARRGPLTIPEILAWADEYQRRCGWWPGLSSGPIEGRRDETWRSVDMCLREGLRGVPGGSSLALLLMAERGRRHRRYRPKFTVRVILAWADAYHQRTGRWPTRTGGEIPESPGDTWETVARALQAGFRGLPGHDSLLRFLHRHRRVRGNDPRIRRQRSMQQM